ncbi:MAG: alpha/beta hydrolase [Bifidobacterium sp.]|nr:alpha/beta hydrolase [Bifidobacterium sp.]
MEATTTNPYPLIRRSDGHGDDIARIARYWTPVDDDLAGVAPERAAAVRDYRLGVAAFDFSRTDYWHDPDGIDVFADLPYLPDGGYGEGRQRGHLLDLYLPHAAIVRGGATLPVIIDIHGGGFMYGAKELNRNFNTHLAAEGCVVFSLNYRLAPEADLRGQLEDVQAALAWILRHLPDWPVSRTNVFLTGDSAGGALAWLTTLIGHSSEAAAALGVRREFGMHVRGLSLVSPAVNFSTASTPCAPSARAGITDVLGDAFFPASPDAQPYLTPAGALERVQVPPVQLFTSSDDFIEAQSLQLATALSSTGGDVELHDVKVSPVETLGHVYPVCMSWLPESREAIARIHGFMLGHCE